MFFEKLLTLLFTVASVTSAPSDYLGDTYDLDSPTMASLMNLLFRDGGFNPNKNQECLKEADSRNLRLLAQARRWAQDCTFALHDENIVSPTPCVDDSIGELVHYSQMKNDEMDTLFEFITLEMEAYDVIDDLCLKFDNMSKVVCNSARQAYWYKADQVECATAYCAAVDGIDLSAPNGVYLTSCAFSYKADVSREPFAYGAPACGSCRNSSATCDANFKSCCTADMKLNTCENIEDMPCEDKVINCELYKSYGFCNAVPSMFDGCHATCDFCFTPPPAVEDTGECVDRHDSCPSLIDDCLKYPWMKEACPLTCAVCDPDCTDMYPVQCEKVYRDHMCPIMRDDTYKCARSCGLCGPMKIELAKCKDFSPRCPDLERRCENNIIQSVCKVTCGVCVPENDEL